MSVELAALAAVLALAAVNGANDVSKGVATLAGSGVASYRTAILWGAVTTSAGALVSGSLAGRLLELFARGVLAAPPTPDFALAVACGSAGWVGLATISRFPVSTTHAIVGALIGAGSIYASHEVVWATVGPRLAAPLLVSVFASYALSAVLNRLGRARQAAVPDCVCIGVEELDTGAVRLAQVHVVSGTARECRGLPGYLACTTEGLHWISSGTVGFARGLNDAPKLVAIATVAAGTHVASGLLVMLVAGTMLVGSLYAGRRVAPVLAQGVVRMEHREGLLANLSTSLLVGIGANLGLPMSTTHVSAGAIAGIAGQQPKRLNRKTLRDLALAWTVTPLAAAIIAASTYTATGLF